LITNMRVATEEFFCYVVLLLLNWSWSWSWS